MAFSVRSAGPVVMCWATEEFFMRIGLAPDLFRR
jgi:hypothetical protein